MAETSGTQGAPGTAETPNPEGGPVDRLERKGEDAGGDGTGGSVNTGADTVAGDGPTTETSKAGGD